MTPDEYCKDKAASSGSSFYYSFLFLAPERRRAITALYAFCREVDDVVDEIEDQQIARTQLAWWRNRHAQAPANRHQKYIFMNTVKTANQLNQHKTFKEPGKRNQPQQRQRQMHHLQPRQLRLPLRRH